MAMALKLRVRVMHKIRKTAKNPCVRQTQGGAAHDNETEKEFFNRILKSCALKGRAEQDTLNKRSNSH